MAPNDQLLFLRLDSGKVNLMSASGGDSEILVDTDKKHPDGICLDSRSGYMFWTSMGITRSSEAFPANDGTVERCSLDGKDPVTIVEIGNVVTPKQITNDGAGRVYFCDREGMRVMRANYDGTCLETLVKRGNWPEDMEDQNRHCVGIALDESRKHIIWTQKGYPKAGHGRIFRAPADLSPNADPAERTDIEELAKDLPEPIDLEYSHSTGRLYWTDRGKPPQGNSLNVADLTDTGLKNHRIICVGLQEGIGLALNEKEDLCYVTDLGGSIRKVQISTGEFETIYKFGMLTGIALRHA